MRETIKKGLRRFIISIMCISLFMNDCAIISYALTLDNLDLVIAEENEKAVAGVMEEAEITSDDALESEDMPDNIEEDETICADNDEQNVESSDVISEEELIKTEENIDVEELTEMFIEGEISAEEIEAVFGEALGAESYYSTYDTMLADWYVNYNDGELINLLNNEGMPYKYVVETRENSSEFKNAEVCWNAMKLVNEGVDFSEKEMIVKMLMEIVVKDIGDNTQLEKAADSYSLEFAVDSLVDVCDEFNGSLSEIYDGIDFAMDLLDEEDAKKMNELASKVCEKLHLNEVSVPGSENLDQLGSALAIIKSCKDITEVVNAVGEFRSVSEKYRKYERLFGDMAKMTNDIVMKDALLDMQSLLSEADRTLITDVKMGATKLAEGVMNLGIDNLKGVVKSNPVGFSILAGSELTDLGYNFLFSTDKKSENYYCQKRLYDFDQLLEQYMEKMVSKVENNNNLLDAQGLNAAIELKYKTIKVGFDYTIESIRIADEDENRWYKKMFLGVRNDYDVESAEKSVRDICEKVDALLGDIKDKSHEVYLEEEQKRSEARKNNNYDLVGVVPDTAIILTEPEKELEELYEEQRINRNIIIRHGKTYKLHSDEEIRGFVRVEDGCLDLNGYSLKCGEDICLLEGTIVFNGGTLSTDSNFYIGTGDTNKWNGAALVMDQEGDTLNVAGDFTIHMDERRASEELLSEGTITVKGNFSLLGKYSNFSAMGNQQIVFDGSELQTIVCENKDVLLNKVIFKN